MNTDEPRRLRKRYKIDAYWAQYEALREQALVNRLRKRPGGVSAMIREALDDYSISVSVIIDDDHTHECTSVHTHRYKLINVLAY